MLQFISPNKSVEYVMDVWLFTVVVSEPVLEGI